MLFRSNGPQVLGFRPQPPVNPSAKVCPLDPTHLQGCVPSTRPATSARIGVSSGSAIDEPLGTGAAGNGDTPTFGLGQNASRLQEGNISQPSGCRRSGVSPRSAQTIAVQSAVSPRPAGPSEVVCPQGSKPTFVFYQFAMCRLVASDAGGSA